jgi:ATP-dependent Lhr-like helicase
LSVEPPFDPRVRAWFEARYGRPTDVQRRAWPVIAAGAHALVTAPTGSGKTLAAFLWALDRLLTGAWERGNVRVLYVSPLKALGNDVRKNLLEPLEGLSAAFGGSPGIGVQVRTGDTPAAERRAMLRRPPEILVTTPESLNLLLASRGGRSILGGVRTAILDEIHAVAGNKRGVHLMTAVERLVALSGEVQRVALSATVRPLELVAAFVGGVGRDVRVVQSAAEKRIELAVRSVPRAEAGPPWPALAAELRQVLAANRSTLFFVNNRALAEKLARLLNEGADPPLAYAHHGSLSREVRSVVETRLKEGSLRGLVATSSLELGIDIGSLDEVVLVQAPRSVHSGVQRVGRAGHAVGATSRGRLYPTHGRDFLEAAVLGPLVEAREVEAVRPVHAPLDVLAQALLAMAGVEELDLDAAYALLRRTFAYRDLSRGAFDRVVGMLRGRYEDVRIRELRPRLLVDPGTGRARAADGVLPLVWRSGGVIPDRGYFALRVAGSGARLGELDEEFVWERRVGDTFALGAQSWRIERITRSDVEVVPGGRAAMAPFWRADAWSREFETCERIGRFLEEADAALEDPAFRERLLRDHRMDEGAADALLGFLRRQREATGAPLPHRRHLLVEHVAEDAARQVVFHACWGGRVLRPLAMAVAAAWEERHGGAPEVFTDDDCLLVHLQHEVRGPRLRDLVRGGGAGRLVGWHV